MRAFSPIEPATHTVQGDTPVLPDHLPQVVLGVTAALSNQRPRPQILFIYKLNQLQH